MKKISILVIAILSSLYLFAQDWTVNPHDYEFLMSVTGQVKLDEGISNQQNSKIAAFVNDQCRGVTTPTEVAGNNMYFLSIYSNFATGDTIEFRFLDSLDQITTFNSGMLFIPDRIIGIPDNPYLWMMPEEYAPTDFLTYSVPGMIGEAEINLVTKEIGITLEAGTNLTSKIADFTLAVGAKAYVNSSLQVSGSSSNNYSQNLTYVVNGVDGSAAEWNVITNIFNDINTINLNEVKVFPNVLADNQIHIVCNKMADYTLYSSNGKILLEGTTEPGHDYVNTPNLTSGIYILKVYADGNYSSFKIIVP